MKNISLTIFVLVIFRIACFSNNDKNDSSTINDLSDTISSKNNLILIGAQRFEKYLSLLENKSIGMVVNQTSVIGSTHLVDTLLSLNVNIKAIYAPEHGFSGKKERGEYIKNGIDSLTGISIISIYADNKKPSKKDLSGIEIMIFDMQDVGARFFTYIGTLHYVMEACAEQNINLIVLDRPNPLGYYIAGPVLDTSYRSFIGMHPVPIVHGMTIGEYALMINGEGWLKNSVTCNLKVVKIGNYSHNIKYELPVSPSPNLPDMKSIYLYPTTCLFEGVAINEGRGTEKPFQQFGNPTYKPRTFSYTPVSIPGYCLHPKFEGQVCYGYDLSNINIDKLQAIKEIDLRYLIEFYNQSLEKNKFFDIDMFDLLAGGSGIRNQMISGMSNEEIKRSWIPGIKKFIIKRDKYLLYK